MTAMRIFRISSLFFIFFFFAHVSYAQEFSANTVSVVNGKEIKGKMYYKPDRWRIEAEAGDRRQISIFRRDRKIIWHIAEQLKQYLEFPLRDEDMQNLFTSRKVTGEVKREALGKEAINGRETTKYKVYFQIEKAQGVMYQWMDEEYRFAIKSADTGGKFVSELKNITIGPQRGDLFELPAGYTKYTIPMNK
jgi:hypothetical protein